MDVNQLMQLERPLTDEEAAFMEQEVLKLTQQLHVEIEKLTKDLDPNDPDVARLRAAPGRVARSVEAAIECREDESAPETRRARRRRLRESGTAAADVVYSWETLPVYEWTSAFARVIGRLLASLPRRYHIYAHNLAGQVTLISHCIAAGHRDTAPGDVVPVEELRAYRRIGYFATFTAMDMLQELSKATKYAAPDVANGMSLVGKIRLQMEQDLQELDDAPNPAVTVLH